MSIAISGSSITFPDQTSIGSGNFPKNRVINGDMRIDQRNAGASQTFTAAAALAYSVDRFYGFCTGANVTGARVAGTAPNEFAYRFTVSSASNIGFGTRLEATNTFDLAGSDATLSVQFANSQLTTVTWAIFYASTTDSFGTVATPTRTQIGTGTFTVTPTLTTYSATVAIPLAAITGLEILFTVGPQTSGTWTIDNVQLESGLGSTTFERRPIGTELALCQRYFWKCVMNLGYSKDVGNFYNTCLRYPVSMRAAPTLASGSVFKAATGNDGTVAINIATGYSPASVDGQWVFNSSNNWTAVDAIGIDAGFSAEL